MLPTIIMVTIDSDVPILHAVQFSFALKSNEPVIKRESDGSYQRFFSIDPSHAIFLYRQMSVPPTLRIFGSLPANFCAEVRFPFGCYIECKVNGVPEKLRESLTDQAVHTDGYTGPQQWHANADPSCCASGSLNDNGISIQSSTNAGSSKPVKRGKISPVYFDLADAHKSSWSAFCAVFPDTFIGVKFGRQWRHVKVSDGCTFLFSFWLKHFGIGKKNFHWHLRLHGYYHSKDIRHFPVGSPESLFVLFAAMKIIDERRCFDQISQEGLESLIMHMLITNTDKTLTDDQPSAPSFHELDQKIIKVLSDEMYEFLYPGTVPAPVPAALADKTQTCDAGRSFSAQAEHESFIYVNDEVHESHIDETKQKNKDEMPNFDQNESHSSADEMPNSDQNESHSSAAVAAGTGLSFFGLPNIGLTCGTNASLQCLLHTNDLSRLFSDNDFDCLSVPSKDNYEKKFVHLFKSFVNVGPSGDVGSMLNDLLALMRWGVPHDDPESPSLIRPFFDSQPEKPWDAGEVLFYLIDHICPSTFRLTIKSQLSCLECSSHTDLVPELEYLQLQFPPIQRRAATLEDGLKMFLGKETLLPGDEWNCSHCKKLTRSQKQLFLCNLPNYFFITLKRFVGKKGAGVFVNERIDRIFEVPFEHNFGQSGVYRLYAAICHYAGKVGHFVAYCRPNAMQPWFRCDDQTCKEASEHHVFTDIRKNGYIFFFERKAAMSPTASLDAITQDISRCNTLQMGLDLYNQLSDIAMRQGREFTRVSAACGLLQTRADTYFSKSCRGDFARQCEILATYCDTNDMVIDIDENPSILAVSMSSTTSAEQPPGHTSIKNDVVILSDDSLDEKIVDLNHSHSATTHAFQALTSTLPVLPSIHAQPASAARVAHAFPYKFPPHLNFDLSFLPTVSTSIASSLFAEFKRVSSKYKYVQYADDHFVKSAKKHERHLCLTMRPATTINNLLFVGSDTLDWFFVSLATLYPDVVVLSNFLIHWNLQFKTEPFNTEWFSLFLRNVKDRRPKFVFHPLNLPKYLDRACDKDTNPEYHYVLTFIVFDWSQSPVSSKITVLDPFSDDIYIDAAVQLYKKGRYFLSFNPVFEKREINPIQLGSNNIHCGVYILALALNAIFGTLDTMDQCLNPDNSDNTCEQGLLLRKFVCWDSTQFPSLLDTFLLACPKFSPISSRSVAVKASAWWLLTPYHNIADSLAIKYESIFVPVIFSRGKFVEQDRMVGNSPPANSRFNADSPFFFSNAKVLVKVICIGLIGHRLAGDRKAAKRAALAFQECCSTPFVCSKKDWLCETFGLICVGLVCPCAFVCIVRTLGTLVQNDGAYVVGRSFHDLSSLQFQSSPPKPSAPFRVLHGDPHGRNEVLVNSKVQIIDCDKTILITGECPPLFLFTWYAASIAEQPRNPFHIRALMRIIGRSGLDASHAYFARFYTSDTFLSVTFDADLFEESPKTHWEYDAFLHLFQLLFEKGLEPKLVSDHRIQLKPSGFIQIAFDQSRSNSITVTCENGQLQPVHLGSESETSIFFERFHNHFAATQEQQQQQQQQPRGQAGPTISFDGLGELMQLLSQDRTPQIYRSDGNSYISCDIRPVCSRDTVVPCKIFFERTATGSIKICSAEFQHQEKESFLQENFRKHSTLFNLENEEVIQNFVKFALSMVEKYSSGSDDDSDGDLNPSPPKKVLRESDNVKEGKKIAESDRQYMGWPDWLYWKLLEECGNQQVLESVKESMMRRFGKTGSLSDLVLVPKPEPSNALRPEYFECEVVLVKDDLDRQRCLTFINGESHLSFDTERAVLIKDPAGPCVIQIGTTTNVFIIQVAIQPTNFLLSLQGSLSATKTLICWGDDKKKLLKVLPGSKCSFDDLQLKFSTTGQMKGLDDCVADLFREKYVLSKTWTLSGWDNPQLTKDQIRYASLDVVACHALFLSGLEKLVFESLDMHITFYAFDSSQPSKFKHGFSFTSDFLGHFKRGSISRGFAFDLSKSLPQTQLHGFRALEDTSHGVNKVVVNRFVMLLNSFKFCCSLCSSCWVLQKEWRFFLKERGSFSYLKSQKGSTLQTSVEKQSTDTDEQDAFFCLSMVACFLRMKPSADNLQSLKKSVCSDIYFGYIRETLAHLT
jgi:hypothetical protein